MKTLTINDLKIAYLDEGSRDGETVILAHCASASSREWASLIPLLVREGYRVLAPDFCGYGRSDPWPHNRPFDPMNDINVLASLAELAEGHLHLVGHSHGGVLVLEAARELGDKVASLTLIEPTLFQLLHETGHPQWSVVSKLAHRVVDAVERGDSQKAGRIFTSFWIGRVKWFLLPKHHKRAIAKSMNKVVLEFELVDLMHRAPESYARVDVPVQLITGTRTRAPAKAVGQLLAKALPDVLPVRIRAGHMAPFTHKNKINQLVISHLKSTMNSA